MSYLGCFDCWLSNLRFCQHSQVRNSTSVHDIYVKAEEDNMRSTTWMGRGGTAQLFLTVFVSSQGPLHISVHMIKAESLESIKVCIVFRDKHACIMTGLLSYLPGLQQGSFQLSNQVLSLLAGSSPVPSQLKADALAEIFFKIK